MSCYNGAAYLKTQMDSILSQSAPIVQVSVVDDGSSDETPTLLETYARTDARVAFRRLARNGGVNQGFAQALQFSVEADWYALSDQDDFWPTGRIASFLDELRRLDIALVNHPEPTLLVCRFVACSGTDIGHQVDTPLNDTLGILDPEIDWKRSLLAGNPLYGCCFFFNHALKSLIAPIPVGKTTHDYWIALLAAYFGRIHIAPFVGVHYRQHDHNASYGAPSTRYLKKFLNLGRSIQTDLRSRNDMLALIEGMNAKAGKRAASDRTSLLLLEDARRAYTSGGLPLLRFQMRQQVWRPKRLPNLVRVLACASEML